MRKTVFLYDTTNTHMQEQYSAPPNFKRLLAEKLKLLTDGGKLIKVCVEKKLELALAAEHDDTEIHYLTLGSTIPILLDK